MGFRQPRDHLVVEGLMRNTSGRERFFAKSPRSHSSLSFYRSHAEASGEEIKYINDCFCHVSNVFPSLSLITFPSLCFPPIRCVLDVFDCSGILLMFLPVM